MNMKPGDKLRIDDGRVVRVVFVDSDRGFADAVVVDDSNGHKIFVRGHFKKRFCVWVRFHPYA